MPGVGKTTLGKRLAGIVGYDFLDLDERVEQMAGKPIDRIFSEDGETGFRLFERKALESTLKETKKVIACGGGTPCHFSNAPDMLKAGIVVYLKATPAFILSRLRQSTQSRPLVEHAANLEEYVQGLFEQRGHVFERAPIQVPVPPADIRTLAESLAGAV